MNDVVEVGLTGGNVGPVDGTASKPVALAAVAVGFDVASVRCAVEIRLNELIHKDDELVERIKGLAKERDHSRARNRLQLMTDGYRVDEAITPRLARLGAVLTKALRLIHPLDIFVWPSNERNAYCLPSRKGNRLIMCLYSGLVSTLSSQELLFVMGHEVGHAILRHETTLGIGFDNPDFSPLEVVRVRALERSHEISCDRFGLLACQDVRVASTALFKIASGLNERWIAFDETAYSRHFDELSSISELVDLEDASRTHPLTPLRVKALISFSKSETFARAFGKSSWSLPAAEMEQRIETMLSVLDPDVSELEGHDERDAANHFLFDGALLVIGADGVVAPDEVEWLQGKTDAKWSSESLMRDLSNREYCEQLRQRLEANASILKNKLSENGRANLLRVMCDIAHCAGGIPDTEFEVLDQLRRLLKISVELAKSVLHHSRPDIQGETDEGSTEPSDEDESAEEQSVRPDSSPTNPLEEILQQAKLPDRALAEAKAYCDQSGSQNMPLAAGVRTLVSWAISASDQGGPLSQAQGKKIAVAAIRVCREIQDRAGVTRKSRSNHVDSLVREHGIIALFCRNETVYFDSGDRQYAILSVSRAKGSVVIGPLDDLERTKEVRPHQLRKDVVQGDWPAELSDL